jgi:transcriptional regulator with GAF, ATPase, and Fis domain
MAIDENSFFRLATLRICGNLDLEVAIQNCLIFLRSHMPADTIHVNLFDPGLKAMKNIALATPTEARRVSKVWPLDDRGREFLERPDLPLGRIVENPKTDPVAGNMVVKSGHDTSSFMVLYIMISGARLGNVVLLTKGKASYTEEHLRLFQMLNEPFAIALSNALRYDELIRLKEILSDDVHYFHRELQRYSGEDIIGEDFGLKNVMGMLKEVSPLDSPVLLMGETGVGKEVFANAIHSLSARRDGPFIRVNCGAIPETLIDSELFGHEKGAFTGAIRQKRGCFERADKGTIFLDEVAELPLQAQVRMLRVLQEKEIVRVGGSEQIRVDIRIIAATHQNLQEMVNNGRFRSDLWFRLHVFPIMIPPLRERKEDIPALIHHFIQKKAKELQLQEVPTVSRGAMAPLFAYAWPGNVRELENVVERALILSRGGRLTFDNILWTGKGDGELESTTVPAPDILKLDHIVTKHIYRVLKLTKGKINGPGGAAEILDVNTGTLRHRMKKLGIPYGRGVY